MTSNWILIKANHLVICVILMASVGCYRSPEPIPSSPPHGHHGGHTFGMSEDVDFQMEFTLDEKKRRIIIYVQSSDSHKPYPLAAENLVGQFEANGMSSEVSFSAFPRRKEPSGQASRFVLSLDKVPQQLRSANQFVLTLSYLHEGTTIKGAFRHSNNHAHKYNHD